MPKDRIHPDLDGLTPRQRIEALLDAKPEGEIFTEADLLGDDQALRAEFQSLRGEAYYHLFDGYLTARVTTPHLRRPPHVKHLMPFYRQLRGCQLVETGDRTAWRLGLREWEPLLGYRYYSDGPTETIGLYRLSIRIIGAPQWLRDEDRTGELFRVFHDLQEKEVEPAIRRALRMTDITAEDLRSVIDHARAIEAALSGPVAEGLRSPASVAGLVESALTHVQELQAAR